MSKVQALVEVYNSQQANFGVVGAADLPKLPGTLPQLPGRQYSGPVVSAAPSGPVVTAAPPWKN